MRRDANRQGSASERLPTERSPGPVLSVPCPSSRASRGYRPGMEPHLYGVILAGCVLLLVAVLSG